jgi:uncharacterized membrane protein
MRKISGSVFIWTIGAFFVGGGVYHFVNPQPYIAMMPPYLPWPATLVAVSGIAEVAGGVGVLISSVRLLAAWGLIVLLLSVFPANLHVALHGWPDVSLPRWVLWLRLPLQPVFIWFIYRFCIAKSQPPSFSDDHAA